MASASTMQARIPTAIGSRKLRANPSVNSEPSCGMPSSAATETIDTLLTAATRRPAAITGTASGSSTDQKRRTRPMPMAVAACTTSSGTEPSPSATVRTSRAIV